ncbi:MAG: rRNA pseudouridine synthase [Armatimonadetes bacterium]|nr:rRNA pseudouridine synthase [Armatimonadota bacterium]
MRLHRFIAQCGVTSRRKAEDLIRGGLVSVNGATVTEMGIEVDPAFDTVIVEGKAISLPHLSTFLFNKPRGVVTTMSDPRGRRTVAEFFPSSIKGLKPVGRLDMDTEGLLFVTNDGALAARLTHPKHEVEKEYIATVRGLPDERDLSRLRKGLWIEGGKTAPAEAELVSTDEKKGTASVRLVLHEGRKHQVRLMLAGVGHDVIRLQRTRIGPYRLKGLAQGQMRKLGMSEVTALRKLVGLG